MYLLMDDDEDERRTQSSRGASGCLTVLLVIAINILALLAIL